MLFCFVLAYRFRLARGLGSEASNEGLVSGLKSSQLCFRFLLLYVVLCLVEVICICWQEASDPRPRFCVQLRLGKLKVCFRFFDLRCKAIPAFTIPVEFMIFGLWILVLGI